MSIRKLKFLEDFFRSQAAGGIVLLLCTIVALLIVNSPVANDYERLLMTEIGFRIGIVDLRMSLLHWINDGLMTVFFFVVGMEIKHELTGGELTSLRKALLPVGAALGGMLVPALIYIAFNAGKSTITGWGIPMATDIAFALGVVSLVGSTKAPKGLVVFLTALAIIDDLGAILVIALFYGNAISWPALLFSVLIIGILLLVNKIKSPSITLYLTLGFLLWAVMLKSGIHATIAGVILGLVLPMKAGKSMEVSLNHKLNQLLSPWTTFLIMPMFALANAGVPIAFANLQNVFFSTLGLGIFLGLLCGKQLGVFGAVLLLKSFKIAELPQNVGYSKLYGGSILAGIGFTMSIFIAGLALPEGPGLETAKLSIIMASVFSGVFGLLYLSFGSTQRKKQAEN